MDLADDKSTDNVDSVNQAVLMKQNANDLFNEHANELDPCSSVSTLNNSPLSRNESFPTQIKKTSQA
ncbi:MAG: hypothetical protein NVSMB56_12470 [Pyrinomonadaceae bacterium]